MAIYQEKNKNKIPKNGNSWYFRCYYTDMYGNRKQKQSKMYSGKKVAQDAEREFLNKIDSKENNDIEFSRLTEVYMLNYKNNNKESTYYDTNTRINKYLLPVLGSKLVSKINIENINTIKNTISHLEIKTQNTVLRYLKAILRYGIKNYDLIIPVFDKIELIRQGVTPPKKYNVWDIDEFKIFINVIDDITYKTLFLTLYFTGLRIGELIALTWEDLEDNILHINKSCNKVGKKVGLPKTNNSFREVDLPEIVREHLNNLFLIKSKIYNFSNSFYIFGDINPLSRTTISRYKDYYISKANVKRITIHEFRHSHVSLLRKMEYSVKQIANRIGDKETTVMDTYSHLFETDKTVISKGLNKIEL